MKEILEKNNKMFKIEQWNQEQFIFISNGAIIFLYN